VEELFVNKKMKVHVYFVVIMFTVNKINLSSNLRKISTPQLLIKIN